jgi:hypothetical protein
MSRRRAPLALARPTAERSPRTTAHGSRLSRDRDRRLTLPSFRPASRFSGPALGGSRSARLRRSRGDGRRPRALEVSRASPRRVRRRRTSLLTEPLRRPAVAGRRAIGVRRATIDDRPRSMPSPGHAGPGPRRRPRWNVDSAEGHGSIMTSQASLHIEGHARRPRRKRQHDELQRTRAADGTCSCAQRSSAVAQNDRYGDGQPARALTLESPRPTDLARLRAARRQFHTRFSPSC